MQRAEWGMGPEAEWGRAERRPGIQGAVKSTHSAVAPVANRLELARRVAFELLRIANPRYSPDAASGRYDCGKPVANAVRTRLAKPGHFLVLGRFAGFCAGKILRIRSAAFDNS